MLSISINSQDMDGYPSTVDGCSLMRRELGEGFWSANVVMLRDIFVKLDWMNPKGYKTRFEGDVSPLIQTSSTFLLQSLGLCGWPKVGQS